MPNRWTQPQIDLGLPVDPPMGFGKSDVVRLSGVTARQLDDWVRKGTIVPSVRNPTGSGHRRRYSFRDVVAVRVLKRLSDVKIPPRDLTRAVQTLRRLGDDDLAAAWLVTDGHTVYQCHSGSEAIDLLAGGQGVITLVLSLYVTEVRSKLLAEPAPVANLARARATRGRAERPDSAAAPA
ncbi:MAG TPA: MerR family transcriptional regulator [Micromonosporaceae bacterium]|jgi:DNA-binding transcriptional MerR regulator